MARTLPRLGNLVTIGGLAFFAGLTIGAVMPGIVVANAPEFLFELDSRLRYSILIFLPFAPLFGMAVTIAFTRFTRLPAIVGIALIVGCFSSLGNSLSSLIVARELSVWMSSLFASAGCLGGLLVLWTRFTVLMQCCFGEFSRSKLGRFAFVAAAATFIGNLSGGYMFYFHGFASFLDTFFAAVSIYACAYITLLYCVIWMGCFLGAPCECHRTLKKRS